jgi:hypothetical protein
MAAVVVFLLSACGGPAPSLGSGLDATPSPTAAPTQPTHPIDLDAIVVSPTASPLGMHHDETGAGPTALTMLIISGRQAEFANLSGFVDGRWTTFSGDAGALLSLAIAFDDGLSGDLAYHRFVHELRSEAGYGFGDVDRADLGFEGVCDTGPNPALDGLIETICIWRAHTLVLIAGGPIPPDALLGIAAEMDVRAAAIAPR